MNDNLAQMLQTDETMNEQVTIPETTEEITEENPNTEATTAAQETPAEPTQETFDINITNLHSWFYANAANFEDDAKPINADISGIDPEENLWLTIPHPEGGIAKDGQPKRKTRTFDNANMIPILDLPGMIINIFNNETFRTIHETSVENIFIKYYGANARQVVFCKNVNDILVPYAIQKLKKKEEGINMILPQVDIEEKLNIPAQVEDIIIRYKQIEKVQAELTTNMDVLQFFATKIPTVVDVTHLIQIDQVIINMMS